MPAPAKPSAGGTLRLSAALDQSRALTRLLERLNESRACFAAVRAHLPETLRDQVRPGPIDAKVWTLLVPNGAAAAKLRQLLPDLDEQLRSSGHDVAQIRVRVQAG